MTGAATLPGLDVPPWSLMPERAVMGIDPSTLRLSAAVLVSHAARSAENAAVVVDTLSLPRAGGSPVSPSMEAARLARSQSEIVPWMGELLTVHDPCLVVVETPFAHGRLVPVESFHVIGILLAVLGQFGVRVERMGPSSWKSMALGRGQGGAKKPPAKCSRGGAHAWPHSSSPRTYADGSCLKCGAAGYAVLQWARAAGYEGVLWDEADAIGLATAGGVLLDQESRAA